MKCRVWGVKKVMAEWTGRNKMLQSRETGMWVKCDWRLPYIQSICFEEAGLKGTKHKSDTDSQSFAAFYTVSRGVRPTHFSLLGVQTNAWLFCSYYCYKNTNLYQSKNVSDTVRMYQIENINSFFTVSKDLRNGHLEHFGSLQDKS